MKNIKQIWKIKSRIGQEGNVTLIWLNMKMRYAKKTTAVICWFISYKYGTHTSDFMIGLIFFIVIFVFQVTILTKVINIFWVQSEPIYIC